MITLKSPREIEMMDESGELLADVHRHYGRLLNLALQAGILKYL